MSLYKEEVWHGGRRKAQRQTLLLYASRLGLLRSPPLWSLLQPLNRILLSVAFSPSPYILNLIMNSFGWLYETRRVLYRKGA